MTAKFPKE